MPSQRFVKRLHFAAMLVLILIAGLQLVVLARLVDSHSASQLPAVDVSVGTGVCPHCGYRTPAEPDALFFTCDHCRRTSYGPSNIVTE